MERSPDTYLHKKFKKQLNIEQKPAHQQNDKENKDSVWVMEQSQEKSNEAQVQEEKSCHRQIKDNQSVDNNEVVPNSSTKEIYVSNASILARSSISIENCISVQSSTSCISNVILNSHSEEQCKPASFDTTFSTNEMTNSAVSSTLVNVFSKQVSKEDISSSANEDLDLRDYKNDDVIPPPDRQSSGKYVCKYCNLVCSKPSVLQKHIRAHTNERPYPCNDCGFSFKTRSNLYKHCRSRTHANRVLGTKSQEECSEGLHRSSDSVMIGEDSECERMTTQEYKSKPYKPRFHTEDHSFEHLSQANMEENSYHPDSDILSHHINEIISKNNSIVNPNDLTLARSRINEVDNVNNNEYNRKHESIYVPIEHNKVSEEPLNLTKSRKRSMSEIGEPVAQKSLIKELLLKNLYSDMQCPYCKMIFQTVTELELHKLRSCKGKPSEVKYSRSSSVNVASILTKNKNAFDNLPQFQNAVFPLSSPGPFLGKTRLIDSDKSKSFSFDGGNLPLSNSSDLSPGYLLSPLPFGKEKKAPVKLFGGEVKVHSSGETKSYKIDGKEDSFQNDSEFVEFGGKVSENRVVKSSLQSGGTVLTNKQNFKKNDIRHSQSLIKVYENIAISPNMALTNFGKPQFPFDKPTEDNTKPVDLLLKPMAISANPAPPLPTQNSSIINFSPKNVNIVQANVTQSFSERASDRLASNIQNINSKMATDAENVSMSPSPVSETEHRKSIFARKHTLLQRNMDFPPSPIENSNACNPLNLLVNGKIVRFVPGMPGPVVAEGAIENVYNRNIIAVNKPASSVSVMPPLFIDTFYTPDKLSSPQAAKVVPREFLTPPEKPERLNRSPKQDILEGNSDVPGRINDIKSPAKNIESSISVREQKSPAVDTKKFTRPNSLALKPSTAALKQHHGLTPTIFNQILISPDTPRVEKKYAQHFLHGNYFSYLGLKCSTKPVYCTLNKTQPFYVPHFKKLSMYSEWRQQDTKADKLYVSAYDSRQKSQRYAVAGKPQANLIIHSSYKFKVSELPTKCDRDKEDQRGGSVLGGYESNDDYTYIRGRGRGRYICDQCGIRCKKPSMLKKHIRTHSNDRPYTCDHCNFSFKTKGNLTKHMKSKAHTKNYAAGSSSGSCHITQSSDSDTDDSGMDSSDESSTRHQEHEAAYGLLSLSQKTTQNEAYPIQGDITTTVFSSSTVTSVICMTTEEIAHVSKTNYAKNKILDEKNSDFNTARKFTQISEAMQEEEDSSSRPECENKNITNYLGKANIFRPLTYPYTSPFSGELEVKITTEDSVESKSDRTPETPPYVEAHSEALRTDPKSINKFHVIQKYAMPLTESQRTVEAKRDVSLNNHENAYIQDQVYNSISRLSVAVPTIKVNDVVVQENLQDRKRKYIETENNYSKVQKNDEVIDLSMPTTASKQAVRINGIANDLNNKLILHHQSRMEIDMYSKITNVPQTSRSPHKFGATEDDMLYQKNEYNRELIKKNGPVLLLRPLPAEDIQSTYLVNEQHSNSSDHSNYDNSAMETLADVATKQVKLEKNTLAKSVASEYLKLATKSEHFNGPEQRRVVLLNKDGLIVKPEGNKSCTICSKTFNKPSQLRLHMNIHYLERPFRCDSCSVSFRSKGHLQKHERSAGHHSKLSSSPAQLSSEPRPFKCSDCNIAFRIHGHLAKHLRSKMHIMKLENLAKIPFGLYAELERSNSLLTEINTSDGDQCLESLKTLAKKVFVNDPNNLQSVMNQVVIRENDEDMDS